MKVWILLIKFLFIGALFIINNYQLNLNNPEHFDTFQGLYYGWLEKIASYGLDLTGYVVQSEWLPDTNVSLNE